MSGITLGDIEELAKNMPGGFFIYRADELEELLFVNDVMLDIFGCETLEQFKELTGYTFRGLVHPDDLDGVRESIKGQVEHHEKKLDYVEYRIIRRDGEISWVDDYGRLVNTEDYGAVFYVFLRDITDKHRLQQELMEKQRVELELEKERHLSEVKENFLFNLSHDIRTPMNAIIGYTELAVRHINEKSLAMEYLGHVSESSQHLLSLIDDLLEMSKIENDELELKVEACDLKEQLKICMDLFWMLEDEKKLQVVENIDIADTNVYMDTQRFRRIMGNLIDNAVKYTPDGGTVTISACQKGVSGSGYVRYEFTVQDTGIGMSEEFMKRIYNAFEREESATKTGKIGTGLGLAITKRMLDTMGGSIAVSSVKGEGTTFTVGLPLKVVHPEDAFYEEPVKKEDLRALGEYRILLVEDIEINRMMAEQILMEAGFLVESVADGSDAVEAFKKRPVWYYDLVLMDIQMPVMNGYEATRAIRALKREDTDVIPIVALSANAREEDKRMSLESGMNSHVAKPFDVAHLIHTVNEYVAKREDSEGFSAK